MEEVILGLILAVAGTLAVAGFIVWVRRTAPTFEDVSITVATGESPERIVSRIASALANTQKHTLERDSETSLTITRTYEAVPEQVQGVIPAAADALTVSASQLDVGTRVDVVGRAEPAIVHQVLSAIAKSPPWMVGRRNEPAGTASL